MSDKVEETGSRNTATENHQDPVINIRGAKIGLGPFVRADAGVYERWMNDFDTLRRAGFSIKPSTSEQMASTMERWTGAETRVWFVVYDLETRRPIGLAGVSHIDMVNRTAGFNICIGERNSRNKGYGTEATRLVLDYAFMALGLHSVFLITSGNNIAGQKAYARAGFKEFGRRREATMEAGRMWDLVYMDCLASEFTSPVLASEFGMDQ